MVPPTTTAMSPASAARKASTTRPVSAPAQRVFGREVARDRGGGEQGEPEAPGRDARGGDDDQRGEKGEPRMFFCGLWYLDNFVRTHDGWRIAHTGYRRTYEATYSMDGLPGYRFTRGTAYA